MSAVLQFVSECNNCLQEKDISLFDDETYITCRECLKERRKKRIAVLKKYCGFLDDMKTGKNRQLKWFQAILWETARTTFKDEEEEYMAIKKYPRGIWAGIEDLFDTEVEVEIIREIASEFGAFDY